MATSPEDTRPTLADLRNSIYDAKAYWLGAHWPHEARNYYGQQYTCCGDQPALCGTCAAVDAAIRKAQDHATRALQHLAAGEILAAHAEVELAHACEHQFGAAPHWTPPLDMLEWYIWGGPYA